MSVDKNTKVKVAMAVNGIAIYEYGKQLNVPIAYIYGALNLFELADQEQEKIIKDVERMKHERDGKEAD